jgi:hypothetical protein
MPEQKTKLSLLQVLGLCGLLPVVLIWIASFILSFAILKPVLTQMLKVNTAILR